MAVTKSALAAEITNDPAGLGYAALKAANNDAGLAALLNDQTKGGLVDKVTVTAAELQSCVVAAEYVSLVQVSRDAWAALLIASATVGVPVSNANIRGQVAAVWGPATTTRTNCSALQQRAGSRAEALWGIGTIVSAADVSTAIR